uniref:Uncharacterized protein n=1 Tax=Chromera velia CCMP2878 TaxID=1169474 RepID=A0A0G4FBJ6_9ALVE|eukprot:Cvel_16150.t1-p1 / transcript=Cvel_16150.t1 / gene=Cvel_16150 / organism=Chromera_velia_CCMP2878 / gene_product=hypothetical protein / transcript_product=hypothetical protein / location=Cvel_scaffold1230:5129-8279(-) / protein_length=471 / sequence_SO=supercontig / SO=protein_coding / is_pseudo=false
MLPSSSIHGQTLRQHTQQNKPPPGDPRGAVRSSHLSDDLCDGPGSPNAYVTEKQQRRLKVLLLKALNSPQALCPSVTALIHQLAARTPNLPPVRTDRQKKGRQEFDATCNSAPLPKRPKAEAAEETQAATAVSGAVGIPHQSFTSASASSFLTTAHNGFPGPVPAAHPQSASAAANATAPAPRDAPNPPLNPTLLPRQSLLNAQLPEPFPYLRHSPVSVSFHASLSEAEIQAETVRRECVCKVFFYLYYMKQPVRSAFVWNNVLHYRNIIMPKQTFLHEEPLLFELPEGKPLHGRVIGLTMWLMAQKQYLQWHNFLSKKENQWNVVPQGAAMDPTPCFEHLKGDSWALTYEKLKYTVSWKLRSVPHGRGKGKGGGGGHKPASGEKGEGEKGERRARSGKGNWSCQQRDPRVSAHSSARDGWCERGGRGRRNSRNGLHGLLRLWQCFLFGFPLSRLSAAGARTAAAATGQSS